MKNTVVPKRKTFGERLKTDLKKNMVLYLMIVPVLAYFIIFKYWPMYGVTIAFKDFRVKAGILGSDWVGLKHFIRFLSSYNFRQLLQNTLTLSVLSLAIGFPMPIIFAVMLNYLRSTRLKKTVQMVSYAPHFISTVVVCGMIAIFLDKDTGVVNTLLGFVGGGSSNLLAEPGAFKWIYVLSGIWQGMGWSAIIYISALSGVDYQMHEAAIIDGASKVQRIFYIDLPSIKSTIIMLLILQCGSLMNVGFEKVYLLQNSLNRSAASTISTYVYEIGMLGAKYSYSTAIGLFNTVINVILILSVNAISKKVAGESVL